MKKIYILFLLYIVTLQVALSSEVKFTYFDSEIALFLCDADICRELRTSKEQYVDILDGIIACPELFYLLSQSTEGIDVPYFKRIESVLNKNISWYVTEKIGMTSRLTELYEANSHGDEVACAKLKKMYDRDFTIRVKRLDDDLCKKISCDAVKEGAQRLKSVINNTHFYRGMSRLTRPDDALFNALLTLPCKDIPK